MRRRFSEGSTVRFNEEALENYGEEWRGHRFKVIGWSDHYVPSSEYFRNPAAHPHGHPGYDTGCGYVLYELEDFGGSVYDWELV